MLLKQAIEEWSALRFMVDDLELFAGNSRKELLHTSFMTDNETLDNLYDQILFWQSRLNDEKSDAQCRKLLDLFSQVVDLEGTIAHLAQKMLLDDVELFELKQIALLSIQINEQLVQLSASKLPNLDGVVALLDPESQKLATFYIYDCYDEELSVLRKTLRARKDDVDVDLLVRTQEIENRIRRELSEQLQPYAGDLLTVLKLVGTIDVLIGKARQSIKWQCVRPRIVESIQSYKALYNPQLKHQLELQSKEIQSIDVELNHSPMLLTGINMGGKTLVLQIGRAACRERVLRLV